MKILTGHSKRLLSIVLASLFIGHQSLLCQALATNITNVQGNNGVYNINPTSILKNTDIGLRKYENFDLSKGDIANLIYKYGNKDVNTFLNLVDNTVKINGIVNTVRNGNFYNGKAVFISPNGMIVGSSGVLNVGSLGVYTPNADVYNKYKNNPSKDFSSLTDKNNVGKGSVQIKGHVFAANDVDITSSIIQVPGKMLAGTANNTLLNSTNSAENLFNSLVNTSNINSANKINANNGVITFSSTVGTAVLGDVRNVGNGNINISNTGSQGIYVSGNLINNNGKINLDNTSGTIYGAKTANIKNSGDEIKIVNSGDGVRFVKGSNIENNGNLNIKNSGKDGIVLSGDIKNTDTVLVQNSKGVLSVPGKIVNGGNAKFINDGDQLNISGTIDNSNGILIMENTGAKGLNIISSADVSASGLDIKNSGANGLNINGKVNNYGNASIVNTSEGTKGLNINGNIQNRKGVMTITNDGEGGLNVNYNSKIVSNNLNKDSLKMENTGKGGMYIRGDVNTLGNAEYINKASGEKGLNVFGKTETENGNTKFVNDGQGGLNVYGTTWNTTGKTTMTNTGAKGFNIDSKGLVFADNADITNSGNDGLNIRGTATIGFDGKIVNNGTNGVNVSGRINHGVSDLHAPQGDLYIVNNGHYGLNISGDVHSYNNIKLVSGEGSRNGINIYGKLENENGSLNIKNDGLIGVNVREGGVVNSKNIVVVNNGANGINVKGTLNNVGDAKYTNNGGFIKVHESGVVTNKGGVSDYLNNGANGIVIAGKMNNDGTTNLINKNGPLSVGGELSVKGNANLINDGSQLNIHGVVNTSNGLLKLENTGAQGVHLVSTSTVNSEGIEIKNSGADGIDIQGKVNNKGNASLYNSETGTRGLTVYGTFANSDGNLDMVNKGEKGLNVFGKVSNSNGKTTLDNSGNRGINVTEKAVIDTNGLEMSNTGEAGINIWGLINNEGEGSYKTEAGTLYVIENAKISNKGDAYYYNNGKNGLVVSGEIANEGTTTIENNNGPLSIVGKLSNNGDTSIINNNGDQVNISGTVDSTGDLNIGNKGVKGINIVSNGVVNAKNVKMDNSGENGIYINGTVDSINNIETNNTGSNGILFNTNAKLNAGKDININDSSDKGIRVWGSLNSEQDININGNESDLVIGDMSSNDNYLTSGRNVNIEVTNGNVKNYGVKKTLINAKNDIDISVTNGKIGESQTVINKNAKDYKYRALNVKAGNSYVSSIK